MDGGVLGFALAELAWVERRADAAARLYGAAAALRERTRAPLWPHDTSSYERSVAAVHTALGDAAFVVAWEAGRTTPLERVIADLEQEHRSGGDRTTPDVTYPT